MTSEAGATAPRDPDLWFGLWLTPRKVRAPIDAYLQGKHWRDLDWPTARDALEGVALLQWLRSLVVGVVLGGMYLLASSAGVAVPRGEPVVMTLLFTLPAYTIVLGLIHLRMRGTADRPGPVAASPALLRAVRWAPGVSVSAVGVISFIVW